MFAMRHGRSLAHYESGDPLGQAARVHRESPKRLSEQRSRRREFVSDENISNKKCKHYEYRSASDTKFGAKFEAEENGNSMRNELFASAKRFEAGAIFEIKRNWTGSANAMRIWWEAFASAMQSETRAIFEVERNMPVSANVFQAECESFVRR